MGTNEDMGTVLLSAQFADRRTVPMSYYVFPMSSLVFTVSFLFWKPCRMVFMFSLQTVKF